MWCVSLSISMQEIARNCITQHHPGYIRRYKDIYSDLNWGDEFCFIVWCVSHRPPNGTAIQQKIRRFIQWACGLCTDLQQHVATHCGRAIAFARAVLGSLNGFFPSETEGCESTTNQLYNILWRSVFRHPKPNPKTLAKGIGAQGINTLQQFQ